MSDRKYRILDVEEDDICSFCGRFRKCRPYGLKGRVICFECAFNKRYP
jgi:hypothetical protein